MRSRKGLDSRRFGGGLGFGDGFFFFFFLDQHSVPIYGMVPFLVYINECIYGVT